MAFSCQFRFYFPIYSLVVELVYYIYSCHGFDFDQYMQVREQDPAEVTGIRPNMNLATEHCKSISCCLANLLLCTLVGLAICCQISGFSFKFWWSQKAITPQQHPLHQNQPLQTVQQKQQQSQNPSKISGKWRMKLLCAFVCAGLTGSIWLFWHLNEDIVFRRKETLTNMCDERARMLQDQFNVSMNHVHALAILISTFHHGKQPSAIDQVMFSLLYDLNRRRRKYNKSDVLLHFG